MPQFVPRGPIVPDELVQALEDDRVALFCGAGISMGAGLPDFRGLVQHCYTELVHPTPGRQSRDWDWPDRMLGTLEGVYTADRLREVVRERLSASPTDLELHRAILRLARLRRSEGLRLVTTNFDTYFEQAQPNMRLGHEYHSAPILPIPRNDRQSSWRSIVYLHGRLQEGRNDHLVLTSADFGRAYLTDAWAARFVSRLFADFTVLFIGYSLNDPVLRYMTDAFAAEDAEARYPRRRGPAYIFSAYAGPEPPDSRPYTDRNLRPIFYHQGWHHRKLRETLIAWATAREDYLANTTVLISRIAPNRPNAIDPTDTSNLLWAVVGRRDDLGHGARTFAGVNPVPPIEWFDELERRDAEIERAHAELVEHAEQHSEVLPVAPPLNIRPIFLRPIDCRDEPLSPVTRGLISWLIRHLQDDGFIERVVTKLERDGRLHLQLRRAIRARLQEPNDLPEVYRTFWRVVSAEGGWSSRNSIEMPAWSVAQSARQESRAGWLRQELLGALKPSLRPSRSTSRLWRQTFGDPGAEDRASRIEDIADFEVILADEERVEIMVERVSALDGAPQFWSRIIEPLVSLLRAVFDLYDVVRVGFDPSVVHRPSIEPHQQNAHHRPWTVLFDLIWAAWTHIDATDGSRSRAFVLSWWASPHPGFNRLALAAINHSRNFSVTEKLEVLIHA